MGSALVKINDKLYATPEGGWARPMINKTGSAAVRGTVVDLSQTTDDAVELAETDSMEAIGVIWNSGPADGETVFVVTEGFAYVLLEDTTDAVNEGWARTSSTTAGRTDASTAAPPGLVLQHFQEIGHSAEAVTGGTDELALIKLHFN